MEIKEHVIGYTDTPTAHSAKTLMLLSKEEYQLALCKIHVIRTTDDFNEACEIYRGLKLVWDDTYNTKNNTKS